MVRLTHIAVLILSTILVAPLTRVMAQAETPVQEINGSLAPFQLDVYTIEGLKKGQTLDAFMENQSGNLDPFLSILSSDQNLSSTLDSYQNALNELIKNSSNPLLDLPALRDKYSLAWDDDSGPGHSAALKFNIPSDGSYYLLASGSLSSAGRSTFGNYRLLIGVDAPAVLDGTAKSTGDIIAIQDQSVLESQLVQAITGSLGADKPSATLLLSDINPNDTLYVNVQATSGDLKPILFLRDFSDKPVQVVNLSGTQTIAALQEKFPNGAANYTLDITAATANNQVTSGDYHLLVGINAPDVLSGQVQPNTDSLLKLAIPVKVGFKLQEIVNIDQPNEIMNDVGTLMLEWTDPALAFNPDDCDCTSKIYTENDFNKFLTDVNGKWPDFTFFNQQGNRWIQNRVVTIQSDGHAIYAERFTTDFQLNFDWVPFPFDRQDFYIYVDMLYSEDNYVFAPMDNYSEIDPNNGEDEFKITTFDTQIDSVVSNRLIPTSRFTFHFNAPRHLDYYIFRIFVPILLIISVSYITFFLKDYSRRIEIATGNLLLFIAFSFSLGENYPRMGYLTFMDAIMAITFIINTFVVVLNVYLKWLEQNGDREKADRLEAPFNYIYPLAYLVSFGIAALLFIW